MIEDKRNNHQAAKDEEAQHLLRNNEEEASKQLVKGMPPVTAVAGKNLFFFVLLVGQSICTQMFFKLSQRGGKYEYNTMSAMAVIEGIKLTISLGQLIIVDQRGNLAGCKAVFRNVHKRVYMTYIFLAFSYAAYNQIVFYVMRLVDPGTFSLFKSLTPAAVGFLNFVSFDKTLTQAQVLCIVIQIFGIVPVVASASGESGKVQFTYGAESIVIMTATILFGSFNTVYNASVVKKESSNYPVHVQNSILYCAGFVINLFLYWASKPMATHDDDGDGNNATKSFFYGYDNINVIVLLILQATVGVTISMVYKYGDAVLKTLSQPMVSSILVILSYFIFNSPLDIVKLSGAGTVIAATMLYLKLPSPAPIVAATTTSTTMGSKVNGARNKFFAKIIVVGMIIIVSKFVYDGKHAGGSSSFVNNSTNVTVVN